ncbi:MAG: TRAP transporter large permease [Planctomycetaceae bacterium]|nr:TRAP transporter large permease [Planctomycetaceae bacterium]
MTILILAALFLVFLFIGVPVAFALGIPSLLYLLIADIPVTFVSHIMASPLKNYVLVALPAFLLSGRMMNSAGITDRLFRFAQALVGRFRGGLAYTNIVASAMFASMSGTAVGDAGGLGQVEMEMMDKAGYDKSFSSGVTACSSVLGPLIPPSVAMVVLGATAEINISQLFLGGLIPGILMMVALMVNIFLRSRFTAAGRTWPVDRVPSREVPGAILRGIPPLLTPLIVIGGISFGVVTPTEAAILAIDYSIILGLVYREVTVKKLWETLTDTVETVGTFMIIIAVAGFFTWIVTKEGLPNMISTFLTPIVSSSAILGMLVLGVFFLVVGGFLDTTAAILLVTPVLMPIVKRMGMDPIHFGVVMVVALVIGIVTPPFGICLFVMADVAKLPVKTVTKECMKYLPAMIITLALLILFPQFATWLPSVLL